MNQPGTKHSKPDEGKAKQYIAPCHPEPVVAQLREHRENAE
jgi:hypothetical protein